MYDYTIKKQEEEERAKEQDRQREEMRRVQGQQQVEQQRMYKAEMKNSYKSMLDSQLQASQMSKEIEVSERMNNARIA